MRTPALEASSATLERVRVGGVLAVGEQDDRGRAVVAEVGVSRLDARVPVGRAVRPVDGLPGDGAERGQDAAAERRAALAVEPVDRGQDASPVVGRLLRDQIRSSPNATTPIRMVDGCRPRSARAAAFAASIRVGARSFARHARDTSKARMTVPSRRGCGDDRLRSGRARAASRPGRPASSTGGRRGGATVGAASQPG